MYKNPLLIFFFFHSLSFFFKKNKPLRLSFTFIFLSVLTIKSVSLFRLRRQRADKKRDK